jgi:[protein-PII] uridylyltransferase
MEEDERMEKSSLPNRWVSVNRLRYEERVEEIRTTFDRHAQNLHAGGAAIEARSAAVDALVSGAWEEVAGGESGLSAGLALVAVGGYGRRELFPYSDVDLMFLLDARVSERSVKEPIRRVNQLLWDAGVRVSTMTRTLAECERFDPENVEFTLSLLDGRGVAGDGTVTSRLLDRALPKLVSREAKRIAARLIAVTRTRHAKYGDTLFHLEPNIKDCPGGLRDAHVCEWMRRVGRAGLSEVLDVESQDELDWFREFKEAREFLLEVRTFLHYRHGRDDNSLDWQAQDAAAAVSLGAGRVGNGAKVPHAVDAAYWMRQYFRRARSIERSVRQFLDQSFLDQSSTRRPVKLQAMELRKRSIADNVDGGAFEVKHDRLAFVDHGTDSASDPALNPEVVLAVFAAMARTGTGLEGKAERRIEHALPMLSAHLEDGPNLRRRLEEILLGGFAGTALRAMHALGILELVIPEFHGIDALVIRDAYHRYTVDEHTFVLIDTLHGLRSDEKPGALGEWASRFGQLFRDLPHPELLLLAALLHDTGKGHAGQGHAAESARMAANVLGRLELDGYETKLVLELIRQHLEMSAALRRDVFDRETIRTFAARVPNPELLKMLTLFTYADIAAVHPDALTPWKAENLWRLYIATTNYLDRSVDEERVAAEANSELLLRIHALLPRRRERVNQYLEGFPQRYLQTRTPEVLQTHVEMAWRLEDAPAGIELDFRYAAGVSELTLITRDRPMLFASMAGALAGWGMNIVTADAFSNAHGLVVDSFRFTDTFRTLELNESERAQFVASVRDVMAGRADLEALLASRRRGRKKAAKLHVQGRVDFDQTASTHSTLLQVLAQDTPGLLRALSLTLAEQGCNIEVALVDTEGETAIDVFYVTRAGSKLDVAEQDALRSALLEAIERNAA